MAITKITMPNLGQTTADLTIVAWLKNEGDHVERGETLAEVETDKTTAPIETFVTGFLRTVLQPAGSVVTAGEPIAIMTSTADEPIDAEPMTARKEHSADLVPARPLDRQPPPTNRSRVLATPAAMQMAREHGIELRAIAGTGPAGRILVGDVEAHLGASPAAAKTVAPETISAGEWLELSAVRRSTAARMVQSAREAPQFTLSVDVDMSGIERRRAGAATGQKSSYTAHIVHAVAAALRRHPQMNVSYEAERLRRHEAIHIGLAVATPRGLVAPAVRDADRQTVEELNATINQLQAKAREGRLLAEALSGATFTVSNLGMYGIDRFTAILNPPQAGILAVGRIAPRPVSVNNRVETLQMVTLTLTVDHRAVDGAEAAMFLSAIRELLEESTS